MVMVTRTGIELTFSHFITYSGIQKAPYFRGLKALNFLQ